MQSGLDVIGGGGKNYSGTRKYTFEQKNQTAEETKVRSNDWHNI